MAEPERISPQKTHELSQTGSALLVCAYGDDERCKSMRLEGGLTFGEFKAKLPSLSKDQGIVFYCE